MQSKIQSISNGGLINYQYFSGDKNCNSICKSKHVHIGCKYGSKCKIGSTCQGDGNCICELQMSCNEKFQPRFRGSRNGARSGFRNGAKSGFRNGAKSTPDLGLVKTSISMILETCIEQIDHELFVYFLDYSTLKTKIQGIANGGSINFQFSSNDINCESICKSNQVKEGCEFGFRCNVTSDCQNGNCLCTLQMSCTNERKSNGRNSLLDKFAELYFANRNKSSDS